MGAAAGTGDRRLASQNSRSFLPKAKTAMRAPPRPSFSPPERAREAEAQKTPGLPARLAAANVICDVGQGGHRLDECFSASAVPTRIAGLEARDVALARSIATVALRRLGVIRRALSLLLEKGLPRQATRLEWPLIAAAAPILFLDAA